MSGYNEHRRVSFSWFENTQKGLSVLEQGALHDPIIYIAVILCGAFCGSFHVFRQRGVGVHISVNISRSAVATQQRVVVLFEVNTRKKGTILKRLLFFFEMSEPPH